MPAGVVHIEQHDIELAAVLDFHSLHGWSHAATGFAPVGIELHQGWPPVVESHLQVEGLASQALQRGFRVEATAEPQQAGGK